MKSERTFNIRINVHITSLTPLTDLPASEMKLGDCNGDVVSVGVDGGALSFSSDITAIESADPLRNVPIPNVEFLCDVALIPGPFRLQSVLRG